MIESTERVTSTGEVWKAAQEPWEWLIPYRLFKQRGQEAALEGPLEVIAE